MKVKASDLELIDFNLIRSEFRFIPPTEEGLIDRKEVLSRLPIEIDFAFKNQDQDIIFLFMKCEVNSIDDPLAGYYIFVEGVTVYGVSKARKNLTEEQLVELVQYSGVSIAINNTRNYIQQVTSMAPYKEYILPAIDLNHIINVKSEEE